jgi:hypothetical protein
VISSLGDGHRGLAFADLFRAADGDLGYLSLVLIPGPGASTKEVLASKSSASTARRSYAGV